MSTGRRSSAPPPPPSKTPQQFTDIISGEFGEQWRILGLDIDRFQRTTAENHAAQVQELFRKCLANGYIYKGSYSGQYCVFDELYVNDAKPGDPCPECGRPTETVSEENFYFKLSAFQQKLLDLYEKQPDFILPETRRNEVLAFVKKGLSDLSISRTTIKWGIPVPNEEKHVFYVWFDALTTYMSAVAKRKPVARGPAPDRQRDRALPRYLLAGVSDGRRAAAAQAHLRARLAAV